jgi:hypothetical protein
MVRNSSAVAVALALGLAAAASPVSAQTFEACRVPSVGVIYMINVGDAPTGCLDPSHVPFSWTEGGTPPDGSVATVTLADGAVTSAKIADGTIATADIANGAVTPAKISVNFPTAVTSLPGSSGGLPAADTNVGTLVVNAPSAGNVLVIASGMIQISGHAATQFSSIYVGVSPTSGTLVASSLTRFFLGVDTPSGSYEIPYAVHGLFPVSAGANTFYLVAREDGQSGGGALYQSRMTGVFID